MAQPNKRIVQQRPDGNWEVKAPGAARASAVTPTPSLSGCSETPRSPRVHRGGW